MPALQDYSELNARVRQTNMTFISDRRAARRTTPVGARSTMGQPKAQGQRSIQIDGLRVPCVSYRSKLQATSADLFFGAVETSKGGSDIIDCLRRGHRAALTSAWNCSEYPIPRPA